MSKFPAAFTDKFESHMVADVEPVSISLADGPIKPVKEMTCRQIPEDLERDAEEHIKELLEAQVIEECPHATDWCSPSAFIKKP